MVNKFVGLLVVSFCLIISLLRALGIMDGDFITPLILLSQLLILGYLIQLVELVAKDIVVRYTRNSAPPPTQLHTWN